MDIPADHPPEAAPRREIYSVSRLNREVRALLDRGLGLLWIEGEVSNLSRPGSGHWYFSLKDRDAQVRCAMFRMRNQLIGFVPADGMQVLARVRATLYEPRGDYQLVVEHLEEAGDGLLRRAFEELKKRLAAEGLRFTFTLQMRFVGQAFELPVDVDAGNIARLWPATSITSAG